MPAQNAEYEYLDKENWETFLNLISDKLKKTKTDVKFSVFTNWSQLVAFSYDKYNTVVRLEVTGHDSLVISPKQIVLRRDDLGNIDDILIQDTDGQIVTLELKNSLRWQNNHSMKQGEMYSVTTTM